MKANHSRNSHAPEASLFATSPTSRDRKTIQGIGKHVLQLLYQQNQNHVLQRNNIIERELSLRHCSNILIINNNNVRDLTHAEMKTKISRLSNFDKTDQTLL